MPGINVTGEDDMVRAPQIYQPQNDDEYYGWLTLNPLGFVLNLRERRMVLHHANCRHIKSYRIHGAMTQRGSRKICSDSRVALIEWIERQVRLDNRRCGSCAA